MIYHEYSKIDRDLEEIVYKAESSMVDPLLEEHRDLNRTISITEVQTAMRKAKTGKSAGIKETIKFLIDYEVFATLFSVLKAEEFPVSGENQ